MGDRERETDRLTDRERETEKEVRVQCLNPARERERERLESERELLLNPKVPQEGNMLFRR